MEQLLYHFEMVICYCCNEQLYLYEQKVFDLSIALCSVHHLLTDKLSLDQYCEKELH